MARSGLVSALMASRPRAPMRRYSSSSAMLRRRSLNCEMSGPAHDDDADGVVGGEVLDVLRHELPGFHAHRVPLLRTVEDDPADGSVLLHQEARGIAHGWSPRDAGW